MSKIEPYNKRSVAYFDQVHFGSWRIKVYCLSATSRSVPDELVNDAVNKVLPQLPQPAITEERYGVGFLIVHQGTLRNWFLLDWWAHEDILFQKLFSSPLNSPNLISAEGDSSATACVHELRVIHFESEAWIKTAMCKDSKQGFDMYMKQIFDEFGKSG